MPVEFCECYEFGDECGFTVNGTFLTHETAQLDCCDALLCCHFDHDGDGPFRQDQGRYCAACCDDSHCDQGERCCRGACVEDWKCCTDHDCDDCEECDTGYCMLTGVPFGEICGELVTIANGDSPQLDCCDGLVCCDVDKDGNRCFECCGDWDCPKGTECDHGVCQFECSHDKDCPNGTCCCKSGHCSKHCCREDDDKPDKAGNPGSSGYIDTLPATGSGDSQTGTGWLGAAALGAAAAYLAAKTLREGIMPAPADSVFAAAFRASEDREEAATCVCVAQRAEGVPRQSQPIRPRLLRRRKSGSSDQDSRDLETAAVKADRTGSDTPRASSSPEATSMLAMSWSLRSYLLGLEPRSKDSMHRQDFGSGWLVTPICAMAGATRFSMNSLNSSVVSQTSVK